MSRLSGIRNIKSFVLIVTEGEVTEPQYFQHVFSLIRNNYRLKFKVVPPANGESAPIRLIDVANAERDTLGLLSNDLIYVVCDKDRIAYEQLSLCRSQFSSKNQRILLSNPCFEIWLYFHVDIDIGMELTFEELINILQSQLGYSRGRKRIDVSLLTESMLCNAIAKAKELRTNELWPGENSTDVHLIFEDIGYKCQSI